MSTPDYVIAGQGIAGTTLAFELLKRGHSFVIYDSGIQHSSSAVAAGLINPIGGRKMQRSWMYDELYPKAQASYKALEKLLNISFFEERPIYRIIGDNSLENIAEPADLPALDNILQTNNTAYLIRDGAVVDASRLIFAFRKYLSDHHLLIEDYYTPQTKHQDSRIIFAGGFAPNYAPDYPPSAFAPVKGEILTFRAHDLPEEVFMFKGNYIIPIGDHCFKAGATYSWDDLNALPTQPARDEILQKIRSVFHIDPEIINQQAGVRNPARDRRPVVGAIPATNNQYILNGLGTKGFSLAPYLASALIDHIESGADLPPEVDPRGVVKSV